MRKLSLSTLLGALVALLLFTATASAETRSGESTTSLSDGPTLPEATLLKGAAAYDSTAGSVVATITTAGELAPSGDSGMTFYLMTTAAECSSHIYVNKEFTAFIEAASQPIFGIANNAGQAAGAALVTIVNESEESATMIEPVGRTVTATTTGSTSTFATTLSVASPLLTAKSFNCAAIMTRGKNGGTPAFMIFPIAAPAPPAPQVVPPPRPTIPTPPPAALSIGKAKPLKLKVGKWRTVKVTVTNSGGSATALGALRVKVPVGVLAKPERQKVPALSPGQSTTISLQVKLTAKAKGSSTLTLTGSAPGVTAVTGSLTLKLQSRPGHRSGNG